MTPEQAELLKQLEDMTLPLEQNLQWVRDLDQKASKAQALQETLDAVKVANQTLSDHINRLDVETNALKSQLDHEKRAYQYLNEKYKAMVESCDLTRETLNQLIKYMGTNLINHGD